MTNSRPHHRTWPWLLAALLLGLTLAGAARAADVTVAWDPNPPAENVTGYLLYYGTTSRSAPGFVSYGTEIDVGSATQRTVSLPDDGATYYLALKAYNGAGLRSEYSQEISAVPAGPGSFTLTASAGQGGSITPGGPVSVAAGGTQVFAIAAAAGYAIADVRVDGVSVGAVASYTFSGVTADHSIAASFSSTAPTTYTLTASAGQGGSISPSGTVAVNRGATQVFSISPAAGYAIADVRVDGASVGAVASYTFSDVTATHSISASFAMTDTDGNGIADSWELGHFGTVGVSPTADPDGDGISNRQEFLNGTDPNVANLNAALTPAVRAPVSGGTVASLSPELSVYNAMNTGGVETRYGFVLALDRSMELVVASVSALDEGVGITGWTAPQPLQDKTRYYWRARATSGAATSEWTPVCTFYVDTQAQPTVSGIDGTQFVEASTSPTLEIADPAALTRGVLVDLTAGALPYDYVLTVGPVEHPPSTSGEARVLGRVVEFGPHGLEFPTPVKILLPYTAQHLSDAGVSAPQELAVFTYNTDLLEWEEVPVTGVDYLGQRLVAEVTHFSMYAIGARASGTPPGDPPPGSSGSGGGGGGCFLRALGF